MGEESLQFNVMLQSNSDGIDCSVESYQALPAMKDECIARCSIDKCNSTTKKSDGSVCQPQQQAEKEISQKKKPVKPQDNPFEKSKKWYNISFMHRIESSSNSRSSNTTDKTNSIKMDNRHSWHLNDSLEM